MLHRPHRPQSEPIRLSHRQNPACPRHRDRELVRHDHQLALELVPERPYRLVDRFDGVTALDAEERANQEARTSGEITDFLVDLFQVNTPGAEADTLVTAREILDRGAGTIRLEPPTAGGRFARCSGGRARRFRGCSGWSGR